jgi:hypothetical protein
MTNAERAEAIRQQQYQVLNRIVREALKGWERSCQVGVRSVRVTNRASQDGAARETVRQLERGPGDPRFLQLALEALDRIPELFGIGLPGSETEVPNSGPIEIVSRWGELPQPVEPMPNATATVTSEGNASGENAALPGNTATTEAEQNQAVR